MDVSGIWLDEMDSRTKEKVVWARMEASRIEASSPNGDLLEVEIWLPTEVGVL
jgi:hypothetical protein